MIKTIFTIVLFLLAAFLAFGGSTAYAGGDLDFEDSINTELASSACEKKYCGTTSEEPKGTCKNSRFQRNCEMKTSMADDDVVVLQCVTIPCKSQF